MTNFDDDDYLDDYDYGDPDYLDEPVRCPRCGGLVDENLWFSDDDPDMEHPFCECGYEWPVAEDVRIVDVNDGWEYGYGYFPGGDPRNFTPDLELCTEQEIANWKEDCGKWNRGEPTEYPGNHFPITDDYGQEIGHITAPRYGLGTYRYRADEDDTE